MHPFLLDIVNPSDFTLAELQWMQLNLPIFSQCQHDIAAGNSLLAVFVHFDHIAHTCTVSSVYESEASYGLCYAHPASGGMVVPYNTIGTWAYRSYNQLLYKRTSDIKHLCFEGIDVTPHSRTPWHTIFSTDGCGQQHFGRYDRAKVGPWLFCLHYNIRIQRQHWHLPGNPPHRPVVYLASSNHMISPTDLNPHLPQHRFATYAVYRGERGDSERWARRHVAGKWTLQRMLQPNHVIPAALLVVVAAALLR